MLAGAFARALDMWRTDSQRLSAAWMESAHPVGTRLRVHAGDGGIVEGTFDGIEPDGGLRLKQASEAVEVIRAGDIFLV